MHFFMRYLEMRFVMTRLSVKNMQMQRAIGDWYFLINHRCVGTCRKQLVNHTLKRQR